MRRQKETGQTGGAETCVEYIWKRDKRQIRGLRGRGGDKAQTFQSGKNKTESRNRPLSDANTRAQT